MPEVIATTKTHTGTSACPCPACIGLRDLERPRYFAGQLLTESELNDEQSYVLAKGRLHNRYLHGWGVVCGLQVACDDCDKLVVTPGYAIDPCGNDIVLTRDESFDVLQAIRTCQAATRQEPDCEPYRSGDDKDCRDVPEHWCITLAYEECETRWASALRESTTRCVRCGQRNGNGNGNGNGCGCGARDSHAVANTMAVRVSSGSGQAPAACEPTRVIEGHRFGVVAAPADHCGDLKHMLQDTALARVANCLTETTSFITRRVPVAVLRATIGPTLGSQPAAIATASVAQDQYEAHCRLREAVRDLYVRNPMNARCGVFDVLREVEVPLPPTRATHRPTDLSAYGSALQQTGRQLYALLFQYAVDCVCKEILPSCPTDPGDDRVILGCVTVLNDKVVSVCNMSCRRFAGAFPSVEHWLSFVPVLTIVSYYLQLVCCTDWLERGVGLKNNLFDLIARMAPGRDRSSAFSASNLRGFDGLIGMFSRIPGAIDDRSSLSGLAQVLREAGGVVGGVVRLQGAIRKIDELSKRVEELEKDRVTPTTPRGRKTVR
jgi:hypothetical protein